MTGETYVIFSGLVTFGVPLVLAVFELRRLGPSAPRRDDRSPPQPVIEPLPRPLPDCLLPRPVAVRVRVLEDA